MAITSASFTIMDYTDGISLITGIDSNLPFTSLFDEENNSLNPSWAGTTSLQLTPKVMKAGSTDSLIPTMTGKKWQVRVGGGAWTDTATANGESMNATNGILTVNQDKLLGNNYQVQYKFSGTYLDPILGLTFPTEIVTTFSRVSNGTSFVVARAYAPSGAQFKNNEPSSLTVKAELVRKSGIDSTNIQYTWEKSTNGTTWTAITGATTDTLTVSSNDVDSFAMFHCKVKDTDASSNTYNQVFTTEGVAFMDISDPMQAVIESSGGSVFKNKTGSSVLTCRLFKNGQEIDTAGTEHTYSWTCTDKDGTASTLFTPTTGKSITVSHSNVDVKANFFVEID